MARKGVPGYLGLKSSGVRSRLVLRFGGLGLEKDFRTGGDKRTNKHILIPNDSKILAPSAVMALYISVKKLEGD